jgi:hypothetical protein
MTRLAAGRPVPVRHIRLLFGETLDLSRLMHGDERLAT